jgi:hypothetical protein
LISVSSITLHNPTPANATPPQAKIDGAGGEALRRARERVSKLQVRTPVRIAPGRGRARWPPL